MKRLKAFFKKLFGFGSRTDTAPTNPGGGGGNPGTDEKPKSEI